MLLEQSWWTSGPGEYDPLTYEYVVKTTTDRPRDSRKIQPVLEAIDASGKHCTYAALDLDLASLRNASEQLHSGLVNVTVEHIADTFPKGSERLCTVDGQRVSIWLGSTLVLDSGLVDFSRLETLMRPGDLAIIGLDCHT